MPTTFTPLYKDGRTGRLKVARWATARDSYWGGLKADSAQNRWALLRRQPGAEPVETRSGNGAPRSGAATQQLIDEINRKAEAS